MLARCGRCQTEFPVNGPGRYSCPGCGTVNELRAAPGSGMPPPGMPPPGMPSAGQPPGMPGAGAPPPPPPEDEAPSSKTRCPECEFEFIVGDIAVAICPMCNAEVTVTS
jgi:hypothetical protein